MTLMIAFQFFKESSARLVNLEDSLQGHRAIALEIPGIFPYNFSKVLFIQQILLYCWRRRQSIIIRLRLG